MPRRARTVVHFTSRRRAGRPQLKRDPLGGGIPTTRQPSTRRTMCGFIMEEPKPATKVAFGILGTLSLICGFVAALLGAAAWFLSHQRTGTEGLAVIAAVFFQWVAALVGGYILGVPVLRQRSRAARLGVFLSVASVVLTALALILHYASSG